jgi:hypothetical protein
MNALTQTFASKKKNKNPYYQTFVALFFKTQATTFFINTNTAYVMTVYNNSRIKFSHPGI